MGLAQHPKVLSTRRPTMETERLHHNGGMLISDQADKRMLTRLRLSCRSWCVFGEKGLYYLL